MRKAVALMIGAGIIFSASAQSISLKINGTRNHEVVIDGRSYSAMATDGTNKFISITDLPAGQHQLQVLRANKKKTGVITVFTTRTGYETLVTVAANGSVHVNDKPITGTGYIAPMGHEAFTSLLQRTRNHWRNSSRLSAVKTAIADPKNYFTTEQLRMLLESFDGEVERLQVAKQAYSKVTDPLNFGTLATVFSIAENREDLSAYVRAQGRDVVYSYSESFRIPMADQKFNQVMDGIEQQWQEGARLSTIIDLFENNRNYFTSSQAVELISSVADESSRLHLAKAVYSRLTDPENFATIYSLFSDTAMVSSLRSYIAASADNMIGVHNYGKTALSDDQFADLYQASRSHFRSKSILRAVHEAFTDSARFYTSYQARQLIMLVKNENDRLQLAKDAYRQIVDAENFLAQMNDLFAWEANRQQLADYVAEFKP